MSISMDFQQNTRKSLRTFSNIQRKDDNTTERGVSMVEEVTNKQLQFITWLITTATDKCQTIEEVRELNKDIRLHSDGLIDEDFTSISENNN